ncbi:MAG: TonB-dependent receptor, partial [bacterium]
MLLNSKLKYLIIIFVFTFLNCNFAFGQDDESVKYKTEEINVFSNKIVTNKFDSPTKVQFITSKEISNKNGETLSDILQLGGNIFIKSYGGNYSLNTISMNGLGAEQTLILLNGFKINSYQNNQIDLNTIEKENIEKVEILNNGSSSIYGSEAIGGVINITTKNNFANNLKANLKGEIGSYTQKKIYAGLSKRLSNYNINLNYSKESSLNNYEYFFNNGSERILKQRANSNYDFSNYSLNFNYFNKNINVNLYSSYTDQLRKIPGIETGSEPSNSNQLDQNWNSILSFENDLHEARGNLSFKSQINFQNNLSNYADKNIINSF